MLGAAVLVLAQAVGGGGWSGARPAACASLDGASAGNVWERAKSPRLRRYCDSLASGAARLASGGGMDEANEALARADEASRALPGQAAPEVLRGRALARLGRWNEATVQLEDAKAKDPRALDEASALLAWGRSLARTSRVAEAEAAYRALLPLASSLPTVDRGAAEIEAAMLALARGPAALDEAAAALRQARKDAQDVLADLAVMALALTLDRAGEREESRAVLGRDLRKDPRAVLAEARAREVLADAAATGESDALVAMALEDRDAKAARDLWAKYIAAVSPKGPWVEHARAHQTAGPAHARAAK